MVLAKGVEPLILDKDQCKSKCSVIIVMEKVQKLRIHVKLVMVLELLIELKNKKFPFLEVLIQDKI